MRHLKTVLQETEDQIGLLGRGVTPRLVRALREHRRKHHVYFVVLFVLLVAVVFFGALGVGILASEPGQMAAFAGAMGITVGGTLQLMRSLWREWSRAGLLLILVEDADEAEIAALVRKLIDRL